MSTAMTLLGYGALPNGADLIAREQQRESGQDALEPDPLREYAEKTWPAKNGHKAGCCALYPVEECECQRASWKPLSAGNYPSEPNPPMQERDPRDRD